MSYDKIKYRVVGDRGLLVELGDEISPKVSRRIRELFLTLEQSPIDGVLETIPSYRSLLLRYDPLKTTSAILQNAIETLTMEKDAACLPAPKSLQIPVVYGGEYGPDLKWVAGYHGISPEEVIRLHTGATYQVYMIGFMPGFTYLGELPHALFTPRRDTPRTSVPKGSVGIAQRQTGIYPVESPGGWQIIGRTPLRLFDPTKWPPTPLAMGDLVTFYPIQEKEWLQWER